MYQITLRRYTTKREGKVDALSKRLFEVQMIAKSVDLCLLNENSKWPRICYFNSDIHVFVMY